MWTADWGQLLPHVLPTGPKCSTRCCLTHTRTDTHTWTVTTGSSRKLWRAHTHSDIVSFFHLRSSRMNSRSITNCTQREQDEKNNLERRGRAGGCAAPCSTGVTAPLHHHNKPKGTLGKKSYKFVRGHSWFVSDILFKVWLWLMEIRHDQYKVNRTCSN